MLGVSFLDVDFLWLFEVLIDDGVALRSDNAFGRTLDAQQPGSTINTPQTCIAQCIAGNFTIAGMEFSGMFVFSIMRRHDSILIFSSRRMLYVFLLGLCILPLLIFETSRLRQQYNCGRCGGF
jgi:hypothetical protein